MKLKKLITRHLTELSFQLNMHVTIMKLEKNGTRKNCPTCDGKGYTLGAYHAAYDNYDIGHVEAGHYHNHCSRCNGRGYLELKWE